MYNHTGSIKPFMCIVLPTCSCELSRSPSLILPLFFSLSYSLPLSFSLSCSLFQTFPDCQLLRGRSSSTLSLTRRPTVLPPTSSSRRNTSPLRWPSPSSTGRGGFSCLCSWPSTQRQLVQLFVGGKIGGLAVGLNFQTIAIS